LFSTLVYGKPELAAAFIKSLSAGVDEPELRDRVERTVSAIRGSPDRAVEVGLQTWPAADAIEAPEKLLVGVSAADSKPWTHNQRKRPVQPRPDAWLHVPGLCLLVFEFKNDTNPLDATQIGSYAIELGLLDDNSLPFGFPKPGDSLSSPEQSDLIKKACRSVVVDASWDRVVRFLSDLKDDNTVTEPLRTLAGQAQTYLKKNVAEPYCSPVSILRWLQGEATSERRRHLRFLVQKLGDELDAIANDGDVVFAKNRRGEQDVQPGTAADAYVPLERYRRSSDVDFLGRRVKPVLWFAFAGEKTSQTVGIELYVQASGAAIPSSEFGIKDWNVAAERHMGDKLEAFRVALRRWGERHGDLDARVTLTAVSYRGTAPNWQGGGKEVALDPELQDKLVCIPISNALSVFDEYKDKLWVFPKVSSQSDIQVRKEELVKAVRKAGISLVAQTPKIAGHASDLRIEQFSAALRDALDQLVGRTKLTN
jgi:hypothetical protein